jgi:hypothetical protein
MMRFNRPTLPHLLLCGFILAAGAAKSWSTVPEAHKKAPLPGGTSSTGTEIRFFSFSW